MMSRNRYSVLILLILSFVVKAQDYKTHLVVAKDGSGDYLSIQEAVNAAKAFPEVPVKIRIKAGIYNEKVHVYAWNTKLSFIGDPNGGTIITYDDYFDKIELGRNSTFHTYTLKVEANDFYARDLIIENTAGDIGQAVALHVEGDRVFFEKCEIRGNQDTMYLARENARHYFKNCLISGTTDFIFGEATAFFDQCEIRSKKSSYITAASTSKGVQHGFVFINCKLTSVDVTPKSVYLGRPWRAYARTVFIGCEMDKHIHPHGWKEWNGKAVFYAEYGS
jgi:pectinesterase